MESTLTSIHKKFGVQLHEIICNKVGHRVDCHDIMQEVFLKIMLNINKIEQADNMAAYLVKLTNNAVIDHYRRSKPVIYTEMTDDIHVENDIVQDQSLKLADCCLQPMIKSLPGIYKDALIETEVEGMKLKDYAAKMGISLSNAKIRVQRAKEKLKDIIMQCCRYDFDIYGNIVDHKQSPCCKK